MNGGPWFGKSRAGTNRGALLAAARALLVAARLHCGAVRCQTRCIQKSLDPKWGETFRFEVAPHQSTQLQIDCFDHDIFSSDR